MSDEEKRQQDNSATSNVSFSVEDESPTASSDSVASDECDIVDADEGTKNEEPTKKAKEVPTVGKRVRNSVISIVVTALTLVGIGLCVDFLGQPLFIGAISVVLLVELAVIIGITRNFQSLARICTIALYTALVVVYVFMILYRTGVLNKFDSTEAFVAFIRNSGGVAELIYLIIQIAQVTFIPIPSTITTVGAQLLFGGFWKPLLLATCGLIIGSMIAFWLGKVFGMRLAKWMVGEEMLEKYKSIVKGRDKFILFYMFLFPFFPDDFLCLLAGLTNMRYVSFFFMMLFTRTVGTAATLIGSMGLFSIPFVGWGIAVWIVAIIGTIVLLFFTIRYSDKIEAFLIKKLTALSGKISRCFGAVFKKKADKKIEETVDGKDEDQGVKEE